MLMIICTKSSLHFTFQTNIGPGGEGGWRFSMTILWICTITIVCRQMFEWILARIVDSFGMADACGTCVLEVYSINNLLQYFQNWYKCNVLFEVKGVEIAVAQFTENTILHTNISQSALTCDNQAFIDNLNSSIQCYAICFYSICYSVIKPCSSWNDLALNAIAEHGDFFYQETLYDGQQFTFTKYSKYIWCKCWCSIWHRTPGNILSYLYF